MADRLKDRLALITGASRGIGAAVARRFAAEGAQVILVARDVAGLEAVDDDIRRAGGRATLAPLDLLQGEAIDGLAGPLLERYGRLDILVGNAAMIGRLTPVGHFPPKLWEQVFGLNLHANWRLIRALDPLLRASDSGRAIFVTSSIIRRPAPYFSAYAASKAALEAMIGAYAAETGRTKLRVNLIDPGTTRTAMRAFAYPGEDPATLPHPETVTEAFVVLAEPGCSLHGEIVAAADYGVPSRQG